MIVVDTNILLYVTDPGTEHHAQALAWFETQMSANTEIGLPWLVLVGFLRIVTNKRIIRNAPSVDEAILIVDGWLSESNISVLHPGAGHWDTLRRLLERSGTAGNLTNDAHIAAIAIEHNALICSADNDFRRFEGVQYYNPFQDDGVREPRLAYA